jgi:serine/threonine-protein kinase
MPVDRVCPSCTTPLPEEAAYCFMCGTATPQGINPVTGEMRTTPPTILRDLERLNRALGKHYDLGEMIGRGGFAEVFLIHDRRLKRELALKALRPELTVSHQLMERFRREADTVAALRHPHVVPIFDIGEAEGLMYIIMPRILGESLKSLMQREGARPLREAVRILVEAADALGAAHEAGVVHRDVKPENIMLEGKGRRVQLMDFGISKALDSKDGTGLTSTGILVGTPHYMSPEQASGEPSLDHRSDQYSLAVIGYQMIAGTLPFEGESTRAILFQQMIGVPKSLASVMPDLPPTLSDVIDRALSKDPADRFPSMEAFAAALVGPDAWPHGLITREVQSEPGLAAAPTGPAALSSDAPTVETPLPLAPPPKARRGWLLPFASLAAVGTIAVAGAALMRGPADSPADAAALADSTASDSVLVAAPVVVTPPPAAPPPAPAARPDTPPPSAARSRPAPPPAAPPTSEGPDGAATCDEAVRASAWPDAGRLCASEAEAGAPAARRMLAGLYARGDGVPKSDSLAVVWYRRAAAGGDGQAAYHLGLMLAGTTGDQARDRDATRLLRQAAVADVVAAWPVLAERYEQGIGTDRNDSEAAFWYRKAAEQGNRAAQFNLAVMFTRGRGLKKDERQAAQWFEQAATQGHVAAQYELGMAYVRGRGVEKSDSLGLAWLDKAATQGHPEAKKEVANRRRP